LNSARETSIRLPLGSREALPTRRRVVRLGMK
jgi:hypothetical protein